MGKYTNIRKKEFVAPHKIHPVWRGIGFLMMLIVPVMSWISALLMVQIGFQQRWALMSELSGTIRFPDILYQLPYISALANWISSIPALPAKLLFFFLILLVFSGVMSFLYAIIWRLFGPPRYTAIDAPAPRVQAKRYKR